MITKRILIGAAALTSVLLPGAVYSALSGSLSEPSHISRSTGTPALDSAVKPKLLRLSYVESGAQVEALVCIYADSAGSEATPIWNLDGVRPPRDIYFRRSTDGGATWSGARNLARTAHQSSIATDPDGPDRGAGLTAYFGDSGIPSVAAGGADILVAWMETFAKQATDTQPSLPARQGSEVYRAEGGVEIPFAVLCIARSTDGGESWSQPQQLTDGTRDVNQIRVVATAEGFALCWQEDPQGLRPGDSEEEGMGTGGSVSDGTDIWYAAITRADFEAGTLFRAPLRVTSNVTGLDESGREFGTTGASRPWLIVRPGAAPTATAVLAYEERKGGEKAFGTGKFVRYHQFPAFAHADVDQDGRVDDETANAGYIISDAGRNARRVRIIQQHIPGAATGLLVAFLWKEGAQQDGPSDMVMRFGHVDGADPQSTGLRPLDLRPAVDGGSHEPGAATRSARALNVSSVKGLAADTEDQPTEEARGHRGLLSGDSVAVVYRYANDGWLARYTDRDHEDIFFRRSLDGGKTWEGARNLSAISDLALNAVEPRIVKPAASAGDAQAQSTIYIGWGTERHLYDTRAGMDVLVTRSRDLGATWTVPERITGAGSLERGSGMEEISCSADGESLSALYTEEDSLGRTEVYFRTGSLAESAVAEGGGSIGGGGGCGIRVR